MSALVLSGDKGEETQLCRRIFDLSQSIYICVGLKEGLKRLIKKYIKFNNNDESVCGIRWRRVASKLKRLLFIFFYVRRLAFWGKRSDHVRTFRRENRKSVPSRREEKTVKKKIRSSPYWNSVDVDVRMQVHIKWGWPYFYKRNCLRIRPWREASDVFFFFPGCPIKSTFLPNEEKTFSFFVIFWFFAIL